MTSSPRSATRELLSLIKPYRSTLFVSILCGILGGLSVTALLATVNQGLHSEAGIDRQVVLAFVGLCAVALLASIAADIGSNSVGQRVIALLRKDLGAKVLAAPIEQIERYRTHRLIPVLTHDVDTISDFAFAFAPLAISMTVVLGCLGYLATLSLPIFALTLLAIGIGSAVQFVAQSKGLRGFHAARDAEDNLQKHYQAISEGAKELRIHRPRRQRMLKDNIQGTADFICQTHIRAINIFVIAKSFGSMLFFVVIGLALAMQSIWPSANPEVMSGFVLVLLYMKGPLENLIGNLPIVGRAQIAFRRIADLAERFSSPEPHLLLDTPPRPAPALHRLELRNVQYAFPAVDGNAPFTLGPIDLDVEAGEILFIVGENGCGKTTLIKLLLGLYSPQQGEIRVDGQAIDAKGLDEYRQLFTTVFADYFLFEDVLASDRAIPQDATRYLERLEIAHKVSVKDGRFTTTDLSTGQRKRLALVNAWLDERPVLVFDEWAADQDPTFRRIFYTELLPDLKRMGKTIVVISHDDRYFDIADQLIRLQTGRITRDTPALA